MKTTYCFHHHHNTNRQQQLSTHQRWKTSQTQTKTKNVVSLTSTTMALHAFTRESSVHIGVSENHGSMWRDCGHQWLHGTLDHSRNLSVQYTAHFHYQLQQQQMQMSSYRHRNHRLTDTQQTTEKINHTILYCHVYFDDFWHADDKMILQNVQLSRRVVYTIL